MAKETHLLSPDLSILNGIEKERIIKQWNFKNGRLDKRCYVDTGSAFG